MGQMVSSAFGACRRVRCRKSNDLHDGFTNITGSHFVDPIEELLSEYMKFSSPSTIASILLQEPKQETTSTWLKILLPTQSSPPTLSKSTTFNFNTFMELRSNYIGHITNNNNNNIINNSNVNLTDGILFNSKLFHAALLTNTPTIIDHIMQYINFNFTTLDIPHDQFDLIKQLNVVNGNFRDEPVGLLDRLIASLRTVTINDSSNDMLCAIVDAAYQGHYESILHLINNYHLSPTIPIYDLRAMTDDSVNLLYYATMGDSLQLIEYLLPLCFKSTAKTVLNAIICNIAQHGHLHLIKPLHHQYQVDLFRVVQYIDHEPVNLICSAVESDNIELIDYLIEVIGFDVNQTNCIAYAVVAHQWKNVQYLISKYKCRVDPEPILFYQSLFCKDITPDQIDLMMKLSHTTKKQINMATPIFPPPLFILAQNNNIICMKHLIQKYNANPQQSYQDQSILDWILDCNPTPEMLQYLRQIGINFNRVNNNRKTPIQTFLIIPSQPTALDTFKLLISNKAIIGDVFGLIINAIQTSNWSIIQYLLQNYDSKININCIQVNQLPLLHRVVTRPNPSLQFIQYLISLNGVKIAQEYYNGSLIYDAMTSSDVDFNIIKLLCDNGAKFQIKHWLEMFSKIQCDAYIFFQCLDYFQSKYDYNIQEFSFSKKKYSFFDKSPLNKFTHNHFNFNYTTIQHTQSHFNLVIIYRALIHRYKANVNIHDQQSHNTVFHYLAQYQHLSLIQFTLSHSHHKPNIMRVNRKGQTFLLTLIQMRDVDQYEDEELEDLLDCICDIL